MNVIRIAPFDFMPFKSAQFLGSERLIRTKQTATAIPQWISRGADADNRFHDIASQGRLDGFSSC